VRFIRFGLFNAVRGLFGRKIFEAFIPGKRPQLNVRASIRDLCGVLKKLSDGEPQNPVSTDCLELILQRVQQVYDWLGEQTAALKPSCRVCGVCCDFDHYGHRLYITTPEMLYFLHYLPFDLRPMTDGVCPYRQEGRCTVYSRRFAACRIFCCTTDPHRQHQLSEEAIARLKSICREYDLAYRYIDLKYALSRPELLFA